MSAAARSPSGDGPQGQGGQMSAAGPFPRRSLPLGGTVRRSEGAT